MDPVLMTEKVHEQADERTGSLQSPTKTQERVGFSRRTSKFIVCE